MPRLQRTVTLPFILLALAGFCRTDALAQELPTVRPEFSTVGISTLVSPPSYLSPWSRGELRRRAGSGLALPDGRILTNASLVANHSQVEVWWQGVEEPLKAEVQHICNPCDLALLSVEESLPLLWEPLKMNTELPAIGDPVSVVGWTELSGTLRSTPTRVSSIDLSPYAHSFDSFLQIQLDTALPDESIGGPAFANGRLIGMVTQGVRSREGRGSLIPTTVIQHFLDDVEDGKFDGFPDLGVEVQGVTNPSLRSFLGLEENTWGALIQRIDYGSPGWGVLEPGDLLLEVDGHPIGEDLKVDLDGHRVDTLHLIQSRQIHDKLPVSVLRGGAPTSVEIPLNEWSLLVPFYEHKTRPSFFVVGGLVVQPLSFGYLNVFQEIPPHLYKYVFSENVVTRDRGQVLVVTRILEHPLNDGYEMAEDQVIRTVDGRRPRDLQSLARIVDEAKGPWLEIVTDQGVRMVFDLDQARALGPSILSSYGVPMDRSPDLKSGAAARATGLQASTSETSVEGLSCRSRRPR